MKLKDVFEKTVQFFKEKKIETARLDAEILLAHALKIERLQIYLKYEQPLSVQEVDVCREVVRRRNLGEPVAYIVGEKGFFGEIFDVGPGVLIPRPESEIIVEEAIKFLTQVKIENPVILDLGAGTGCLGLSILKQIPNAKLIAVEKSEKAAEFWLKNAKKLQLEERAQLILQDVEKLKINQLPKFQVIVANPPYIDREDPEIESAVKSFEPHEALFTPAQGLYCYQQWLPLVAPKLAQPGLLLFEIGYRQAAAVSKIVHDLSVFSKIEIIKDLSGLDRTLKCVSKNKDIN